MALEEDSGLFRSIPPDEEGALAPDASGPMTDAFDPTADASGLFTDTFDAAANASSPPVVAFDATPDSPTEPDEAPRGRPAPSSRRRPKAARAERLSPAKLATAVAKLRTLEDAIVAHVHSADHVVRRLESRGVHSDAGYSSGADFEQRILLSTPLIKSMRESIATSEAPRAGIPAGGVAGERTRRTKALDSVAQALAKLRQLDVAIHRTAIEARDALVAIESERLFEECGYLSFEEFLERALGPSPVLAAAVALAECEPPLTTECEPPLTPERDVDDHEESNPVASDAFEDAAALSPDFVNAEPAAPPVAQEAGPGAPVPPARSRAPRARLSPAYLAATLALCILATFGGGAAGSWTVVRALARTQAEPAPTHVAASPPASSHPSVPASAPAAHPPKEKRRGDDSNPPERAPQAARNLPLDPLAIPVVLPHSRTTGPREARR